MRNELRDIASTCYEQCDEAVGIIEFLEAGNTPEVEVKYCGGNHIANIVRKAMKQRLIMSIMRMHDGAGKDRETLLRAFSLLSDPALRLEVLNLGGDELRLDAAIAMWPALKDNPAEKKMRAVRDFESAHNIPSKVSARPTVAEAIRFSKETIKLVEDLAAGTGVSSVAFNGVHLIWGKRAVTYWACLQQK